MIIKKAKGSRGLFSSIHILLKMTFFYEFYPFYIKTFWEWPLEVDFQRLHKFLPTDRITTSGKVTFGWLAASLAFLQPHTMRKGIISSDPMKGKLKTDHINFANN